MDTRLLEYFDATAAEGSVTAASSQLFAAQSTVSAGIQSLERDLGARLFDRSERRLRLTPTGEDLLPLARDILAGVERLRVAGGQARDGVVGRIRVGVFSAMDATVGLPEAVGALRAEYPGVTVQLIVSAEGSAGHADDLLHGRLDLALFALPPVSPLKSVALPATPYAALVPVGHRLASRSCVSLSDLVDDLWVDVPRGFGNRAQVEIALSQRGLARRVAAEVSGLPSIPAFVAARVGVAVVPRFVSGDGCVQIPLQDDIPAWAPTITFRPESLARPTVARLIALVQESAARASESGR